MESTDDRRARRHGRPIGRAVGAFLALAAALGFGANSAAQHRWPERSSLLGSTSGWVFTADMTPETFSTVARWMGMPPVPFTLRMPRAYAVRTEAGRITIALTHPSRQPLSVQVSQIATERGVDVAQVISGLGRQLHIVEITGVPAEYRRGPTSSGPQQVIDGLVWHKMVRGPWVGAGQSGVDEFTEITCPPTERGPAPEGTYCSMHFRISRTLVGLVRHIEFPRIGGRVLANQHARDLREFICAHVVPGCEPPLPDDR